MNNATNNTDKGKDKLNEYIGIINQFDTPDAKRYWIDKLNVSNAVKGKLTVYFNLLRR